MRPWALAQALALLAFASVLVDCAAAASVTVVFRGDAWMHHRHAAVFFQVVHGNVVNFQLDRIDVIQMRIGRRGAFSGCNTREAGAPCVRGTLNAARDHASGTVRTAGHLQWKWSAAAIGTQA